MAGAVALVATLVFISAPGPTRAQTGGRGRGRGAGSRRAPASGAWLSALRRPASPAGEDAREAGGRRRTTDAACPVGGGTRARRRRPSSGAAVPGSRGGPSCRTPSPTPRRQPSGPSPLAKPRQFAQRRRWNAVAWLVDHRTIRLPLLAPHPPAPATAPPGSTRVAPSSPPRLTRARHLSGAPGQHLAWPAPVRARVLLVRQERRDDPSPHAPPERGGLEPQQREDRAEERQERIGRHVIPGDNAATSSTPLIGQPSGS